MINQKWVERWFERARQISEWSKDPSTKVGCVYVDEVNHRELTAGYNGFPRGIKDDERLYDRNIKYSLVTHAEINGICSAASIGISLKGSSLFVWGLPVCNECAKGIIQVGVSRVYIKEEFLKNTRWSDSWGVSKSMFDEAGIEVIIV